MKKLFIAFVLICMALFCKAQVYDKATIKTCYETGDKPTQEQFWHWMDSYWHKSELIPSTSISGLQTSTDTIYRRNDSVFGSKNGQEYFITSLVASGGGIHKVYGVQGVYNLNDSTVALDTSFVQALSFFQQFFQSGTDSSYTDYYGDSIVRIAPKVVNDGDIVLVLNPNLDSSSIFSTEANNIMINVGGDSTQWTRVVPTQGLTITIGNDATYKWNGAAWVWQSLPAYTTGNKNKRNVHLGTNDDFNTTLRTRGVDWVKLKPGGNLYFTKFIHIADTSYRSILCLHPDGQVDTIAWYPLVAGTNIYFTGDHDEIINSTGTGGGTSTGNPDSLHSHLWSYYLDRANHTGTQAWSTITSTPTTLLGYGITDAVPSLRTITINGVAHDLSTDRSWTVSSVSAGDTSTLNVHTDGYNDLRYYPLSSNPAGYLTSYTETDPLVKAINGIVKSNGTTISAAVAGTDYVIPSALANFVDKTISNTYTPGATQIFGANGTNAGFRLAGVTANPSSLTTGDLWFRSDEFKFKYYDGSTVRSLVSEQLAQTLTNKTLTSPVINVGSDASGDMYYRNGSGIFSRIATGTTKQSLHPDGSGGYVWKDTTAGGAGVSGSGVANRLSYWSSSSNISYVDSISVDNSVISVPKIGIGTLVPTTPLTFNVTTGLGTTGSATGISLYSTRDQTTNWNRGHIFMNGGSLVLTTEAAGTSSTGFLYLNGFSASIDNNSNLRAVAGIFSSTISGTVITASTQFSSPIYAAPTNTSMYLANGFYNNSSGNIVGAGLIGRVSQSGTAGYSGFVITPWLQGKGSGTYNLLEVTTNTNATGTGTKTFAVKTADDYVTTFYRPLAFSGSAPSYTLGTGAGTSPTASITGTDAAGYITINTGTTPATGDIVTITFATALTNTPTSIKLTPANDNAIDVKVGADQSSASTTSFKIRSSPTTALAASTTYKFYYTITQ